MERPEHADGQGMTGDAVHQVRAPVLLGQPVAVRHETAPSGHVDLRLAPVERDSQVLREEVATPAIVIAAHQGDGDALGPQRLESRDRAEMAPRDHRPILEPEVEQVAVDEQRLAQVGDGFEELVERGLDGGWDLSQMGVGDDEHAGWHGPKLEAAPQRRKPRCCILPGVISTITLRVNYSETDQMGVVYHANYLIWFDRARTELMRETGVTYKELEQQGVYLAVSEVKVRYRAAARYDDLVRVRCWVRDLASRRVTLDRKSTRLNSSHGYISYAVFCLKKKKK